MQALEKYQLQSHLPLAWYDTLRSSFQMKNVDVSFIEVRVGWM
jgi:hypothetical protein